jgi:hypothetical protein
MEERHWAYFRCHQEQKSTLVNIRRQAAEIAGILRREGVPPLAVLRFCIRKKRHELKRRMKGLLLAWGLLDRKYAGRSLRLTRDMRTTRAN